MIESASLKQIGYRTLLMCTQTALLSECVHVLCQQIGIEFSLNEASSCDQSELERSHNELKFLNAGSPVMALRCHTLHDTLGNNK